MNSRRFIIDSFNMSDNSLSYPNKYDSWTVQNSETTHTQRLFVRIVNVQSLFISHYVDLWVLWIISLVFFLFLNFCTVSKVFGSKIWIKSKRYLMFSHCRRRANSNPDSPIEANASETIHHVPSQNSQAGYLPPR